MQTMTRSEAKKIMDKIKKGKKYSTRFQEQEWGIYFQENGSFVEWGRETDLSGNGKDHSFENILNEQQVIELLLSYNYKRTLSGLK